MSYCRWSSDFGECDVYVYEDVNGGWTTHVAGRRLKHKVPDEIKAMPRETAEDWFRQMEAERKWRESLSCDEHPCNYLEKGGETRKGTIKTPKDSEYEDLSAISPEYAGETFHSGSPKECAKLLEQIRASGLNVPQYAIDSLLEEWQEMIDED